MGRRDFTPPRERGDRLQFSGVWAGPAVAMDIPPMKQLRLHATVRHRERASWEQPPGTGDTAPHGEGEIPLSKRLGLQAALRHRVKASEAQRQGTGAPAAVEIEQNDGGYYLFYLDGAGHYLAHGSHETLEDAKAKAHRELAVEEADWVTPTE
jgi:hypothetical protein